MVKKEENRKLRGSVLLTVVVVMSLLIVFLFGTLTLATAANNRAHVNYSSAQTDVTSRTVVDAAINALEDVEFRKFISANVTTGGAASTADIDVQLGDSVPNKGKYGDISKVRIQKVGTKAFYNQNSKSWVDGDIVKFTASVSMAGVDSTTSAYVVKHPAGEAPPPAGGGGAGFVTTASATLKCQTNIFGGAYINLPRLGEDLNGNGTVDSGDTAGAIFYNYDYRDDYSNWASDPTNYRQFDPNGQGFFLTNADNAFTIENDLYVNNNMEVYIAPFFIFPSPGTGLTVWGDFRFGQDSASGNGNQGMRYLTKYDTSNTEFNKLPFMYIDGTVDCLWGVKIGEVAGGQAEFPMNLFCGSFNEYNKQGNNWQVAADVYCMNPGTETNPKWSYFNPKQNTQLYKWSGSVVNNVEASDNTMKGGICSKGCVYIENLTINGDVRVEKDCKFGSNVIINGDLVVGGKIEGVATVNGNTYCDNASGSTYKVRNETLGYIKFKPKNVNGTYVGLFGEEYPASESNTEYYFQWKENIPHDNNRESQISQHISNWTWNNGNVEEERQKVVEWIRTDPEWPKKASEAPHSLYNNDRYYVETIVPDVKSNNIGGDGYLDNNVVNNAKNNGTLMYGAPTNDAESEMAMSSGTTSSVADYGKDIYPKYAERDVILGRTTIPGVDISKTKIVKRLEEILDSNSDYYVSNPYNYDTLDTRFTADYTKVTNSANGLYFTTKDQIISKWGSVKNIKYIDFNNITPANYTGAAYETASGTDATGAIIKDSCCLDNVSLGGSSKNLVIAPGDKDILIVIKNGLSLEADGGILIDDTGSGSVNFYLESGATFTLNKGIITTCKYGKAFADNRDKAIKIESPNTTGAFDISAELGRPRINIYGASGSKIAIENSYYIVANVLSPSIDFRMAACNDAAIKFSNVYYHDTDVLEPTPGSKTSKIGEYVFGCINSMNVEVPNYLNVFFVPDQQNPPVIGGGGGEGDFEYRILYYDEY